MGYSISEEQARKLDRNRAEGRLCGMSTGRGGCFNRATVRQTSESWYYEEDKLAGEEPRIEEMVFCSRHANTMPEGYEGRNFRVLKNERF